MYLQKVILSRKTKKIIVFLASSRSRMKIAGSGSIDPKCRKYQNVTEPFHNTSLGIPAHCVADKLLVSSLLRVVDSDTVYSVSLWCI
jgi:hypothetical protein